jgi:high-affinity Fe2+/Pb2+ permease
MLRSLLGYSADPTLIEGIAYAAYLVLAFVLWRTGIIGRIAAPRVATKSA